MAVSKIRSLRSEAGGVGVADIAAQATDPARAYRHKFRVFEVEPVSKVQVEVVLISSPDSPDERKRDDRLTSGVCVGSLRLLVDRTQMDAFAVGTNFLIVLQPIS